MQEGALILTVVAVGVVGVSVLVDDVAFDDELGMLGDPWQARRGQGCW